MPPTRRQQSAALTRPQNVPDRSYAPDSVARVAAAYGEDVPLPPGWSSAGALNWPEQSQGDPVAMADIQTLVQHNAIADWIGYAVGRPDLSDEERALIAQLPDWTIVRGSPWGEQVLRPLIDDLLNGDSAAAERLVEQRARLRRAPRP